MLVKDRCLCELVLNLSQFTLLYNSHSGLGLCGSDLILNKMGFRLYTQWLLWVGCISTRHKLEWPEWGASAEVFRLPGSIRGNTSRLWQHLLMAVHIRRAWQKEDHLSSNQLALLSFPGDGFLCCFCCYCCCRFLPWYQTKHFQAFLVD